MEHLERQPGDGDDACSGEPITKPKRGMAESKSCSAVMSSTLIEMTYDDVAAKLLRDNFLLTALELHTELIEAGKDLPRLKEYFSHPSNFESLAKPDLSSGLVRSSSQATLDSLDFARYSDDGERIIDDRVAVLEFELRKANETISSLRSQLTHATESEAATPDCSQEKPIYDDATKPHEQRAINFLVNEYLLKHGYKLTSNTFSDENENQDFEDWDDVGLNISKPADIVSLFRDWMHQKFPQHSSVDAACQTDTENNNTFIKEQLDVMENELTELRNELSLAIDEKHQLILEIESIRTEKEAVIEIHVPTPALASENTHAKVPVTSNPSVDESQSDDLSATLEATVPDDMSPATSKLAKLVEELQCVDPSKLFSPETELIALLSASTKRKLSDAYQKAIVDVCLNYQPSEHGLLALNIATSANSCDRILELLAVSLPLIIPNVILNKREELIPLIVSTINLHEEPKTRDKLLNILFNLIKRPDKEMRQMILTGFLSIAQRLGPHCVESELLPQCWEQINHKYVERRLLVAESCGVLLPFTSNEIRNSLVLSMLQQIMSDKDEQVREAGIKSLALLMAFADDDGKFTICLELTVEAIRDSSESASLSAIHLLLPLLGAWSLELGTFAQCLSSVMKTFAESIQDLKRGPSLGTVKGTASPAEQRVLLHTAALHTLIPFIFLAVAQKGSFRDSMSTSGTTLSFPSARMPLEDICLYIGSSDTVNILLQTFDSYLGQEWYQIWPEINWATNVIDQLLQLLVSVPVSFHAIVKSLVELFCYFCHCFGPNFTKAFLRPACEKILWPGNDTVSDHLTQSTVPVYILGILLSSKQDDDILQAVEVLKKILWTQALYRLPVITVIWCFEELAGVPGCQTAILTMLWEGVVHTSVQVREIVADLLGLVAKSVSEDLVSSKVIPALITLASDPEISVRVCTVSSFGVIIQKCSKKIHDKPFMQLQTFVDDPLYKEDHSMQVALIQTLGKIAISIDPRFRDDFILARLAAMAFSNNQTSSKTKRADIATALLEVYCALLHMPLSKQVISECIIPALRCLHLDIVQLLPMHEETVLAMLKEMECRVDLNRTVERSASMSLASASASVGQGMEDMKNRVSKLFHSKPGGGANITTLSNPFKKK